MDPKVGPQRTPQVALSVLGTLLVKPQPCAYGRSSLFPLCCTGVGTAAVLAMLCPTASAWPAGPREQPQPSGWARVISQDRHISVCLP